MKPYEFMKFIQISKKEKNGKKQISFGKVPQLDLVLFVKHLGLMLKAGLPLWEAVETVREQATNKRLKEILDKVAQEIQRGGSLGSSLDRYSDFDKLFVNMVKVGEESGSLEENLEFAAQQLEKVYILKRKVKAAMIYPVLILIMAFGLAAVLTVFVLPKLMPLFRALGSELPLPTRILVSFSNWVQDNTLIFLSSPFLLIIFIKIMRGYTWFRKLFEALWLHTPILGKIMRKINLAYFARTLSILLKSGITIVEALSTTAESFRNLHYKESLNKVAREITGGTTLAERLKQSPSLFPLVVTRIIEVGEKTGNLETTLTYLSNFYEQEVDETLKSLSSILEPLMLIAIGVVVGFIALSILSPIYSITSSLEL